MTDFNKVEKYYSRFDEWSRLDQPSGKLEYDLTMSIIIENMSSKECVLDLGGGPGRYTISLAKLGHSVYLADLSDELLESARNRVADLGIDNVESIDKVNAIDLSKYADNMFDTVLLMGPLYHLINSGDREKCIKEIHRVLKPKGMIIASYLPKLTGAIGIVDRAFYAPSHVSLCSLKEVFETGVFHNNSDGGFQEASYIETDEILKLFRNNGFNEKMVRSVRGFGYKREEEIYMLQEKNRELFDLMIDLINQTATREEIIETCGHALYVGYKV